MDNKVNYKISLGSLSDFAGLVHLEINQSLDSTHSFNLIIRQSVLLKNQASDFLNKQLTDKFLSEDIDIEISEEKGKRMNFKGIVTRVAVQTGVDYDHYLHLEGRGYGVVMEGTIFRRTFVEKSLKEIVEEVFKTCNIPSNVSRKIQPTYAETIPFVMQYDESHWAFLRRLAYDFGQWFYYDGTTFYFGEPSSGEGTTFTINGKQNATREGRIFPASHHAWTYTEKNDAVLSKDLKLSDTELQDVGKSAASKSSNVYGPLRHNESVAMTLDKVDSVEKLAKAYNFQYGALMDIVDGHGLVPDMIPGKEVNIDLHYPKNTDGDTSEIKYDIGKFKIYSVRHIINDDNFYASQFKAFSAGQTAQPFLQLPENPVAHSELAKVINNQDPDKKGRAKVQFVWSGQEKETHAQSDWLRVVSPYAAMGDGFIWPPEKDSQVLIAFYQGNTYRPYITGNFYHGKPESEIGLTNDNNLRKQFMTLAGNQILFDDTKGSESITITHKKKKDVFMKLQFTSKQVIQLTCSGDIELSAEKNMTFNADNIEISANKNFSMKAGQKAEFQSAQLEIKADTKAELNSSGTLKVAASATAEVSAGAIMTVKGSLVKIN